MRVVSVSVDESVPEVSDGALPEVSFSVVPPLAQEANGSSMAMSRSAMMVFFIIIVSLS